MTGNANPQSSAPAQSPRVQRVVATVRAAEVRRNRRALVVVSTLIACLTAWHLYPYWRMHRLIQELRRCHDNTGRYPASKVEVEFLRGTDVGYSTDKEGSGFALRFSHLCLYDLGELRHFEYESWDDSWFSHAD
jgi:hypothetical protein